MTTQEFTLLIYNFTLLPIIFFSVLFILLTLVNLFIEKRKVEKFKPMKDYPFVSVQIPSFNDPIAARCIERCIQFDYPKDKYEIVIVDDSTNIGTQDLLKAYSENNPDFIKYIHRDNRSGFKPGALKNAMSITNGEIIVIFDADWIPNNDFLKKIIAPFSDSKVAIVQSKQGFYNKDTNMITRFAAYTLMVYHTIMMPINNKINCVFFCGTAGALRKKYFEEVGGWNLNSITEDSDLSVKLLMKGYKSVYLNIETPSEVPDTFESFVKQQMRWCYGNTRVFFDNAFKIMFKPGLTIKQRLMISFITLGNVTAPFVVLMTFFGLSGWFVGEPSLFNPYDIVIMVSRFIFTAGFIVMGVITLHRYKLMHEFKYLLISSFTIGMVLAAANSIAFAKAVFNSKLGWFCTPKTANTIVTVVK